MEILGAVQHPAAARVSSEESAGQRRACKVIKFRASCECGFVSGLCRSRPQAEFSLRSHVCERYERIAARRARGEAKRAAVDRTPKPCLHKVAKHVHGTRACAVLDMCKCPPCSAANAATERHRQRQIAYGRWQPYVDAGPAREHVASLTAAGMGLKRIAEVSGVAHGCLSKLMYGERGMAPSKRVRWETAVRLMVVRVDLGVLAGGARIDVTGTHRRVQALVAAGWSQSKISARIGMNRANFWKMMEAGQVTVRTARAVIALYNELWDRRPPERTHHDKIAASRSRNWATAHEWALPAAWADVDIDDPRSHPNATGYDNDRVAAVMAGALVAVDVDLELALTRVDRLEVLRRGRVVHRWPTAETARQTGISAQQLYTDIQAARRVVAPTTDGRIPPADELQFLLDNGESIAAIALRFQVSEDGVYAALRRAPAA